ncbi:hypothetical protein Plhal304r1_c008g0031461 [Plasmopara halstedii]
MPLSKRAFFVLATSTICNTLKFYLTSIDPARGMTLRTSQSGEKEGTKAFWYVTPTAITVPEGSKKITPFFPNRLVLVPLPPALRPPLP